MKEKRTQREDVLNYLKTHDEGLTHRMAEDMFGVMRLASIVCNLRKDGYNIVTRSKRVKNRYGGYATIGVYILEG